MRTRTLARAAAALTAVAVLVACQDDSDDASSRYGETAAETPDDPDGDDPDGEPDGDDVEARATAAIDTVLGAFSDALGNGDASQLVDVAELDLGPDDHGWLPSMVDWVDDPSTMDDDFQPADALPRQEFDWEITSLTVDGDGSVSAVACLTGTFGLENEGFGPIAGAGANDDTGGLPVDLEVGTAGEAATVVYALSFPDRC
jgi:hypothetical protein